MAACTKVDDTLGQGMIPGDQQMRVAVDEVLVPFEMGLAQSDSIPASNLGRMFIGSRQDAVFGGMTASAMTDFYPTYVSAEDETLFGFNPVADSIFLDLTINNIIGDRSVRQTFNIYAMRDTLPRDSVYMKGLVNLADHVDTTKPLFSFTLGGDPATAGDNVIPEGATTLIKLTPTAEGQAFMTRLTQVSDDIYKAPWPEFRKMFNGLYFAAADGSPAAAAVYDINLRDYTTGLLMWFHNYEESDPAVVADTTYVTYDFRDQKWYSDSRVVNMNLNNVSYTPPFTIDDAVVTTGYIQSLGGVNTMLTATDALMAWFDEAKGDHSDLVLNKARLRIPIVSPTAETLKLASSRLGMYYFFGSGEPIPDYDYVTENYSSSSSVSIPYGGYRTTEYYEMDITLWLDQLMLNPETTQRKIWLGPDINSRASVYRQTVVGEPSLVVTYTLVR